MRENENEKKETTNAQKGAETCLIGNTLHAFEANLNIKWVRRKASKYDMADNVGANR